MQSTEQLALDYLAKSYPKEDWKVDVDYMSDNLRVGLHRSLKRFPKLRPAKSDDLNTVTYEVIDVPAMSFRGWVATENISRVIPSAWNKMSHHERFAHLFLLSSVTRSGNKPLDDSFYEDRRELTDDGKNLLSMLASDLIASANREEKRILVSV